MTAVLGVALLLSAAPVAALPEAEGSLSTTVDTETAEFRERLASKQAELDAFREQLDDLDRELSVAAEAYNASLLELETTRQRLEEKKQELDNAEVALEAQIRTLSERLAEIYRGGELSTLDVLLGAKSVSDLISRIVFLQTIGESDASIAESVRQQRDQIAQKTAELELAQMHAESLEFVLRARSIEIALRVEEREQMFSQAQTELLDLLEAEASRRQKEEAALMQALLSGVSESGIAVEPGSPVETALTYHGIPYVWGGATTSGFDCSGLVMYVFAQHDVALPHYSGAQFQLGAKVAPTNLQPGDVVFFGSPVHHVGIYVGGGYFIHAPRTGDFVKLSLLSERSDYAGARRYEWQPRTKAATGTAPDPV